MSSVAWVVRGTGEEIPAPTHKKIKQHAVSNKVISQVMALFTLKWNLKLFVSTNPLSTDLFMYII